MTKTNPISEPSAYLEFTRNEWGRYRDETPLVLDKTDLECLKGQTEIVSLHEIEEVYLPLSRLLSFYVKATQTLHQVTGQFLNKPEPRVPYLIGVSGSVAVGKSTTSRVLQTLLSRWPHHPRVFLITTDGFLFPNEELERRGLMHRKGFPESYDLQKLISFLQDLKSGKSQVSAPVYSHHHYDIVPNESVLIEQADIVIVEGLNILQTAVHKTINQPQWFVSDFLDFSIFVDAELATLQQWFVDRVLLFCNTSFQKPDAYFHYLVKMSAGEISEFAKKVWREINEVNLIENILPFKRRARLILWKDNQHKVQKIFLRKL